MEKSTKQGYNTEHIITQYEYVCRNLRLDLLSLSLQFEYALHFYAYALHLRFRFEIGAERFAIQRL